MYLFREWGSDGILDEHCAYATLPLLSSSKALPTAQQVFNMLVRAVFSADVIVKAQYDLTSTQDLA